MKRKSLIAFMICLMGITLLIGCSKGSDSNNADKEENVTESAEPAKDEDSDDKNKDEDKDGKKSGKEEETEEAKGSGDDLDLAGAFKEGRVFNNGSYFVLIKDKVYFRNISPGSMEKGATFGEFLRTEFYPTPCPLISYDINTCEWEEIGTVNGTGELYACPQGFYIGEISPEMFDASCTNLYDPVTKETSLYCKGLPLGVSESGEILAVEDHGGPNIETVLIKNGKEAARLGGDDIYYEYVGFDGETLIAMLHTENEEYILCSVDENGDITELGLIGNAGNGYGRPKQFKSVDGYVYVSIGYYEGTGNYLSRWEIVKAKPGVKGSLEVAINGDEVPSAFNGEGPDPDVPLFFFDTGGALDYSEHVPYDAYMGDGDKENDLLYYDDIFEENLLVKDFIDRSDTEKCSIIQDMESITETAFIIYADAVADSEYDIGGDTGYRMTGWHICAVPFDSDHLDGQGLAKEIIHFKDVSDGGGVKSNKGSDSGDKEITDPLEGLVSNDILAKFRESNPVKNPDSIQKEALALGNWVQKSIGKIPAATREKGEDIGRRYEFWFGTDIGNNFDANLPRIYEAYYCLKDYYTSDKTRSADFYNGVMEENEFLGNGNPENIEKMYTDMQGFITDCNNSIRSM